MIENNGVLGADFLCNNLRGGWLSLEGGKYARSNG